MGSPKRNLNKLDKIINGWETLAADKSFGGMTLAQFRTATKPSYDTRARIRALEDQLMSEQTARDDADRESLRVAQLVVNGVIGDPTEGPNSDLYESMGYTRTDERKTGLTRKPKTTG
jgi:hypothetical protein